VSRIAECFELLKKRNRAAFIPYVTCGDPQMEASAEVVRVLADNGADIIELGVPFSDPIADGPVIQRASARALAAGASLSRILEMVADLRSRGLKSALVLFGYLNPVIRFGSERLAREAAAAGVDGMLIADLLPEEAGEIDAACAESGLDRVCLVAPTTPDQRIRTVSERSSGFVYAISLTGVTGARDQLPPGMSDFLSRVRANCDKPVAVGFGISTPEMVSVAAGQADGVVVGSAIVRLMEDNAGTPDMMRRLGSFVRELSDATKR
jgi:tryptophan synthase alpha chain